MSDCRNKDVLVGAASRLLLILTVLGGTSQALAQVQIGETHVLEGRETPHPYPGAVAEDEIVWSDSITHQGARLLIVRFSDFELADGDYVIVRNPDSTEVHRYDSTFPLSEFSALAIFGDGNVITLSRQPARKHVAVHLVVFDEKYFRHSGPIPPGNTALENLNKGETV